MAIVEIEALTYTYPLSDTPALKNINLNIEEGEFLAIIGANGAGKSTLCYTISGFVPHFFKGQIEGRVMLCGNSLLESKLSDWVFNVGLVFQNPFTQLSGSKFTVYEEIAFGLENIGLPRDEMKERIEHVMALTGIRDLVERSPYALSGGQQQRVALASIFVMQPKVLVLDEPTSQLDPIGTRQIFGIIKEMCAGKITVIMAEHKIERVAEFADRVIALSQGEIFMEGSPKQVLTADNLVEKGIGVTRYTSAARLARERQLWQPHLPLPVTLEEAVVDFSGGYHEN